MSDASRSEPRSPSATGLDWWRTVLGEYPTGVSLLTSTGADGAPLGVVVGTFNAVSADPPLVSFMPLQTSRSFQSIRENGTFCVNVLGFGHEDLCRAFARRHQDSFDLGSWRTTTLGNRQLVDAVAWFEGRIVDIVTAGDHYIVIAQVADFGVGDGSAGLPLLFLKGGYGSFTVPSLNFDLHNFGDRMRIADALHGDLERLAEEVDSECLLSTVADDSIVVLSAANLLPDRPRIGTVGMAFPFAAPIAPCFAAWGSAELTKQWIERSRHLLGSVDRPQITALLDSVRSRGYSVSLGNAVAEQFTAAASDADVPQASLNRLWETVAADTERTLAPLLRSGEVNSVQVPVFGPDGTAVFELVVGGLPRDRADRLPELVERAREAAGRMSETLGGAAASHS